MTVHAVSSKHPFFHVYTQIDSWPPNRLQVKVSKKSVNHPYTAHTGNRQSSAFFLIKAEDVKITPGR